ncbi:MAG: LrgB family protein [Colwellia sp.]|nr:LrgB family protein [Colwellia sp.]
MPYLKAFLIPAESCIFKLNGYIGAANHVIGSIVLSRNNSHQGAYSSVALILSAVLTVFMIPL